jgi:hypothetical protein
MKHMASQNRSQISGTGSSAAAEQAAGLHRGVYRPPPLLFIKQNKLHIHSFLSSGCPSCISVDMLLLL